MSHFRTSLQDRIVQSSDELHTPGHPFSHGLPGRTSLNTGKTQLNRLFKSSLTPLINSLIVQRKPPGPEKERKKKKEKKKIERKTSSSASVRAYRLA